MINPSEVQEHMEVVGSDGQHVGIVDKLAIKLTKSDPTAHGQHHLIDFDHVSSVADNKVTLDCPAAEALQDEKPVGN